ncbi:5'-3' exoribonuclease 1 [Theileria orientalis strain Shintoku]|uniref:5'-3' exoribonuclease 1 n=1 Tax=Theileria orientalis strain Shintoku TaxID=869250 RepID=J4C7N2_THEOR|nr:5'-3' exoribonuclease 1 [Theileria orientalis strain Shintoku]BAM39333.1 5'-3' exoribonuclease 1 [Theileria orientalis strain Shintoku]|eukprot:XP_009689634.1 5'-3' exoribonuclease 1 [Theileria orientalis strain Shintoku]
MSIAEPIMKQNFRGISDGALLKCFFIFKTTLYASETQCVKIQSLGRASFIIKPGFRSLKNERLSQNFNFTNHDPLRKDSLPQRFKLQGVPRLYGWMMENFSKMRIPLQDSDIYGKVDYFYVDMNAVIHAATHGNVSPSLMMEDQQRMRRIVTALLKIFKLVKPKKMMYIGVDGVCPSAKINQQRTRRFRLYKSTTKPGFKPYYKSEEGKYEYTVKKLPIQSYDNVSFDPSYISPGTEFMSMMDSELRNWIALQTYEGTWEDRYIVYSGTDVPGEGEHKIYDAIRRMAECDPKVKQENHLVYGLDADLMMLSLITKMPNMYILREKYDHAPHKLAKIKPNPYYSKETGLLHFHGMDYIDFKISDYEVLSMRFLRRIMYSRCIRTSEAVSNDANKFLFNQNSRNRLTDDFSLLSFLAVDKLCTTNVGNDFLPHLPTVELCNSSFNDLVNTYYKMLPKFRGFLTESYKINMSRLQQLMKELSKLEIKYFKQKSTLEKISEFSDPKKYAKYYYENKCDIDFNNKQAIRKMGCFGHYRIITQDAQAGIGVTSITTRRWCRTWQRYQQHQLRKLGEYFPEDFEICEEGKENEWEHVVKLPFLDTRHLSKVARSVNDELKYTNLYKNKPGYTNVYHRRAKDSTNRKSQT